MKRNVKLFPWFFIASSAHIYVPFLAPFLLALQLDNFWVLGLSAVTIGTSALIEIPTGYFADRFGRKPSLILGAIIGVAAFVLYATLSGFGPQAFVAAFLLGVATSLTVGADRALLYETYVALGREHEAGKADARTIGLGGASEAAAALLSVALVGVVGYQGVMLVQAGLFAVLLVISLLFVETSAQRKTIPLKSIMKHSFSRELFPTLVFASGAGLISGALVWWTPVYFLYATSYQIGVGPYGWLYNTLWALFLGSMFVFSAAYPIFNRHRARAVWVSLALGAICYTVLALGHGLVAFLFILITYFLRANLLPMTAQMINERVGDSERATIKSVRLAITWSMWAVIAAVSAWVGGRWGVPAGIVCAGAMVLAIVLPSLIRLHRTNGFARPKPAIIDT